jgi:hypothetical protein
MIVYKQGRKSQYFTVQTISRTHSKRWIDPCWCRKSCYALECLCLSVSSSTRNSSTIFLHSAAAAAVIESTSSRSRAITGLETLDDVWELSARILVTTSGMSKVARVVVTADGRSKCLRKWRIVAAKQSRLPWLGVSPRLKGKTAASSDHVLSIHHPEYGFVKQDG